MGYEIYTEEQYRQIIEDQVQTHSGLMLVNKLIEKTQGPFKEVPKKWVQSPFSIAVNEFNKRITELRQIHKKAKDRMIKKKEKEKRYAKNNIYLCYPQL